MNYFQLEPYISKPRLGRFLRTCNHSQSQATNLYAVNLHVSKAFYPLLHLFEVCLRNSIHQQLSISYNSPDWIIHEKNGMMSHQSLAPGNFYLKANVEKAIRKIQAGRTSVTAGRVVAEQSFGFWVSFYYPVHFGLMSGAPLLIFTNKPASVNRMAISNMLYDIQQFRNRVYHNESICFQRSQIDFTRAERARTNIYNLLEWMNPDLITYIHNFDDVLVEISKVAYI